MQYLTSDNYTDNYMSLLDNSQIRFTNKNHIYDLYLSFLKIFFLHSIILLYRFFGSLEVLLLLWIWDKKLYQ